MEAHAQAGSGTAGRPSFPAQHLLPISLPSPGAGTAGAAGAERAGRGAQAGRHPGLCGAGGGGRPAQGPAPGWVPAAAATRADLGLRHASSELGQGCLSSVCLAHPPCPCRPCQRRQPCTRRMPGNLPRHAGPHPTRPPLLRNPGHPPFLLLPPPAHRRAAGHAAAGGGRGDRHRQGHPVPQGAHAAFLLPPLCLLARHAGRWLAWPERGGCAAARFAGALPRLVRCRLCVHMPSAARCSRPLPPPAGMPTIVPPDTALLLY